MASSNRTAILIHVHKILKKHYKPVTSPGDRPVLECLLYACCLENSPAKAADEVFAAIQEQFFDWNEIRVTSVQELAETMKPLGEPLAAAQRMKRILQSVFESIYAFDLEDLRKQNIGQAVKKLQEYEGTTPFMVSYVTQHALGGHSVPVNRGVLTALCAVGAISEAEKDRYKVPGLERAIPKSQGRDTGSLLHQWGVAVQSNPYSSATRNLLLEIAPDCKERLPKRPPRKATAAAPPQEKTAAAAHPKTAKKKAAAAKKTAPGKKKPDDKKPPAKKKAAAARSPSVKAQKPKTEKKTAAKRLGKRKPR